jgi:outer membrane protein insertion porin family
MRRRLVQILLTICTAVVAVAPTARAGERLEVRGARLIGNDRAAELVKTAGWSSEDPEAGLSELVEAYFRRGYLLARAAVELDARDSTWVVTVDEGERARIGRSRVAGEITRDAEALLSKVGLETGSPYDPHKLTERIHGLLEEYDEAGFPFAQVWIDSLDFDDDANRVDVSLFVIEGNERTLEHVVVEGLKKTRPELAIKMSGLHPGTPYRARLLRDAYLRLTSSGVFTRVEEPTVRLSPDGVGVDVVLVVDEPQRSHTFTSALGYATEEGTSKRQISGLASLQLNNIGGTLRNLGVFWSNDGRDRVETRVQYRDQFFLSRPLAVEVTIHQVGLDTLYTWQSVGVEVERAAGRIGGSLLGVSAGLSGDRNVFSVGEPRRSWRVRASLGARYLGGGADASLGVKGRFTLARKKRIPREGDPESLNQYITEVETDAVVRVGPVLHLRNALRYRGLESNEKTVPLSELFYIGGARTLRGYKENQFSGRRTATAQTELLLGRTRSENVYVFGDVGYVLRESLLPDGGVDRSELVRAGYGFGLRTQSRLGNVDLSFGVGEKLSLRQTKVHVLLEQSF